MIRNGLGEMDFEGRGVICIYFGDWQLEVDRANSCRLEVTGLNVEPL